MGTLKCDIDADYADNCDNAKKASREEGRIATLNGGTEIFGQNCDIVTMGALNLILMLIMLIIVTIW